MLLCERTAVCNFENAVRGARNPLCSWARSDSHTEPDGTFVFGENDLDLARRLCLSGSDHRKFIRQIFISVDITAPIYWWKEFDTYKVGTVANSTSTMHRIHSKPFSPDDFSHDQLVPAAMDALNAVIRALESLRLEYLRGHDRALWYSIIQLLPSSYNQKRTVTLNYENAFAMYNARRNHKLQEWHTFCGWVLGLPYFADMFPQLLQGGEAGAMPHIL